MDSGNTLAELEQDAEALLAELHNGRELPRVQRSLQQMRSAGERLAARSTSIAVGAAGGAPDVLAARLLANQGQQLPRLPGRLDVSAAPATLTSMTTFESLEPAADTDIHTFLKNERDNSLLTAIEKTRKQTFEESEERCLRAIQDDWEREKQHILNTLVGPSNAELPELRTAAGRADDMSCVDRTDSATRRSTLTAVELSLARALDIHTAAVCAGGSRPDLCSQLAVAATGGHGASKLPEQLGVSELWSLVETMCQVESFGAGGGDSVLDVRCARRTQEAWTRRALRHLESGFSTYMRATVLQALPRAQLGGVPGVRALVKGFVALRLQQPGAAAHQLEDGSWEGRPVWPVIYYCLRCGDARDALVVAREAANNLGDFAAFLEEYVNSENGNLSSSSESKLRLQYRRTVRVGTDPYKRAVYCIMGRCEPAENHTDIVTQVEDFLWLKMRQLSWTEESSTDSLSLTQLQKQLYEEYGEQHFQAWEQPLLYFNVLFLTQQFEAALAFLSGTESLRCHAVHAALALHDRHLLLLSSSIQAQLLTKDSADPPQIQRLNLARLVMLYTRKFEVTDPREALNYYYSLRNLRTPGAAGDSLFVKCVAELAMETGEFGLLLGKLDAQGVRLPGAVDRYQVDVSRLISSVATSMEQRGRLEEATQLLELAGEDGRLVVLLCQLLAGCVSSSPSSMQRQRVLEMCRDIAGRLRLRGTHSAPAESLASLFHLLDLGTFFELHHSGDLEAALRIMDELRLLPTTTEQVETKVAAFSRLNDDVRRTLPEVLLAMMRILLEKHQRLKVAPVSAHGESGGGSKVISEVRARGAALVTFSGSLPYRMPDDVYSRLSSLEIQLN